MNFKFIVSIFLLLPLIASAQNKASIKVISRTLKDEITIRWAPDNATAWQYCNKSGYLIERYTIVRDGKVLVHPEKNLLTPKVILPSPLPEWETLAKEDEKAAIAAQALYGKSFEVKQKNSSVIQMINLSKEAEFKFGIALFCADQSIQIAEKMGLKFSDKNIKSGEKYLYKIYSPTSKIKIDTGTVFVEAGKLTSLPKPAQLKAEFSDKVVRLSWNKQYYESFYSSYIIERSEDGKTFKQLNENPFINTSPDNGSNTPLMYFLDSIPENNKKYIFRIKGRSYFGDLGPASDEVSGVGITKPAQMPVISAGKLLPEDNISIKWVFPESNNSTIKGFKISVAENLNGIYKVVTKDYLKSDQREYIHKTPTATNYYKVQVFDLEGNEYSSLPYMVQLKDNTPPAQPLNVKGLVDSSGIVRISWKANKEMDLLGYRIYMANSPNDEYTQITKAPVIDTVFIDTINIRTLTKNVYYKVIALDNHFNLSKFSEVAMLKRPDIIPPVVPVFKNYSITDSTVMLEWKSSPSNDVIDVILLRRKEAELDWQSLIHFKNENQSYTDKTLKKKETYIYAIQCIDDSGNKSDISQPLTVKLVDNKIRPAIKKIKTDIDRSKKQITLSWDYSDSDIDRIMIYRAIGDEPLRIYKTLPEGKKQFIDTSLQIATKYRYSIRIYFKGGGNTELSKEIICEY